MAAEAIAKPEANKTRFSFVNMVKYLCLLTVNFLKWIFEINIILGFLFCVSGDSNRKLRTFNQSLTETTDSLTTHST